MMIYVSIACQNCYLHETRRSDLCSQCSDIEFIYPYFRCTVTKFRDGIVFILLRISIRFRCRLSTWQLPVIDLSMSH